MKMTKVAPAFTEDEQPEDPRNSWDPELCNVKKAWKRYDKASPVFFADLRIAKDGGLSEIDEVLFDNQRFIWAIFSLVCLVLNLYFIIKPNVEYLVDTDIENWTGTAQISTRAMIMSTLWETFFTTDSRPSPQVILSFLELGMLLFYSMQTAIAIARVCFGREETRWHGVASLLWSWIPELSTFSAMKTLHFVTPKILLPALINVLRNTVSRGGSKFGAPLLRFALVRGASAIIGFEAFVIKFGMAAEKQNESTGSFGAIMGALAFLNQIVGIVDVNKFAHRRLMVFVFGGEDGYMSDQEEIVCTTYAAMLARETWVASRKKRWPVLWFLTATLSYGDQDFQRMVLRHFPGGVPKDVEASPVESLGKDDPNKPLKETHVQEYADSGPDTQAASE